MAVLKYITPTGDVLNLPSGPKGDKGDPGPQGDSAYQTWLAQGGVGTEADFLASIASAFTPTATSSSAGSSGSYLVPTDASLHTLSVTTGTTLDFADYNSEYFGLNPNGWSFTLHIASGADLVTFSPSVSVYGTLGTQTDVWATVVRENDKWVVLVGASA